MRCSDGDECVVGGDGADDDPDGARQGDDDDVKISPEGGNFPSRFLPVGDLFLSIWFPLCSDGGKEVHDGL